MDWYSYFKERFSWGNPYASVTQCYQAVAELLQNPRIPFRVSASAAVDFLAALADFAGDGCAVATTYANAMEALVDEMQHMRELTAARDMAWLEEGQEGGCGPMYAPGDYEVRQVDLEGDGPDDDPAFQPPDEQDIAVILQAMYGGGGEPGTTGTRTPFPDWDHVSSWTATDWLELQVYKDKVMAAAEAGFMGVGSVAGVLAAAKSAMTRVPLPRQVELCVWATEVVDCLMFSLEGDLQKMCAGSLHSHQGRLVQKQLLSVTNGQSKSGPNTP